MATKFQEERKARAVAKADRLNDEANSRFESARGRVAGIPLGQPILVGHHSEKKHRRALAQHDNDMRKGIEAQRAASSASYAAARAGSAILSDDPEALVALREKLEKLEARREAFKAHNKKARKEGGETLPSYCLKNLGANIRSVKKRIAELEAEAARPEVDDIEGDGFTIEEDTDDCRIRFHFDTRPNKETHGKMRAAGFVFSRANSAYQRKLNDGGRYAAKRMARELFGWEG